MTAGVLRVTPAVFASRKHVDAVAVGLGMVTPRYVRDSARAGRWLPLRAAAAAAYEPPLGEELAARGLKLRLSESLARRAATERGEGRGILAGRRVFVCAGTVADDALEVMAGLAGGVLAARAPSAAQAAADVEAGRLMVLASVKVHGPGLAGAASSSSSSSSSLSSSSAAEQARVAAGVAQLRAFLAAGVRVLDRAALPAACLMQRDLTPAEVEAFAIEEDALLAAGGGGGEGKRRRTT